MKKLCILAYPKCARWRFWLDRADAQANLNICWAPISKGTFSDVRAHMSSSVGPIHQILYPSGPHSKVDLFSFLLIYLFLAHLSRRLKVSYCDHSPSVLVVVVRMSVRPSTIFKQHLLLNHWLEFDQTSQEWSLVGPLSKLFKWFRSIAYLGHRS